MRVLYFDRSGYCVWGKRLEAGRFLTDWAQVPHARDGLTELKLLIEGIEIGRRRKRLDLRFCRQISLITMHRRPNPA